MKTTDEYKAVPQAQCSQIIIQGICRDWKAYYKGLQAYQIKKECMYGKPQPPSYYDKARRITRGQFKSNSGVIINADVNAAYQIIKKCLTSKQISVKTGEKVTKLKVA